MEETTIDSLDPILASVILKCPYSYLSSVVIRWVTRCVRQRVRVPDTINTMNF